MYIFSLIYLKFYYFLSKLLLNVNFYIIIWFEINIMLVVA